MPQESGMDALLPQEMALRAEYVGVRKAEAPLLTLFTLAVTAGAFIALGAVFASTVVAGTAGQLPFGVSRLLAGVAFCLGLVLVVVGGAELFTGNTLIVMAWASRKITARAVLRNWVVVYAGNFVGSFGTAIMVFLSKQYMAGGGAVGEGALKTAVSKCHYGFVQALALGILCNALVCMAVWLTFSARSTVDKIVAIVFPVSAFVAAGFEHSVANMYYVPYALLIKGFDPTALGDKAPDLTDVTWGTFLYANLLPVTIGNIIGGTVFVAAVYWTVFLRRKDK